MSVNPLLERALCTPTLACICSERVQVRGHCDRKFLRTALQSAKCGRIWEMFHCYILQQLGLKSRGTGLQFSSRFSAERGLCLYIRKQYAAQNTTHDSTLAGFVST
ncbi:hypothetical protein DEO72_LG4g2861 [Vigna unguiculata]|uniref:Uncharacterized protein n=1 Tax=Vigna unguiculata TaxID=3917 RepID=A0A4D6LSI8_VIGUN|nr:hypothetical protein DEO72_LG4g2861 [Vigna unguiculata]